MTIPQQALDMFRQDLPEMALNPSSKEFARIGLNTREHGVDHPEARAHRLEWSDPAGRAATTNLIMLYLSGLGMQRPAPDAVFTNRFTGKIKLAAAEWAGVRQRAAEFDKILSQFTTQHRRNRR